MGQKISGEITKKSNAEVAAKLQLRQLLTEHVDRFGPSWDYHLPAFVTRQALSRQLYLNDLYKLIVNVPGVICEFGVQWGATLNMLANLRGIYEPYNYSRQLFGFDTFSGFVSVEECDGADCALGDYSVSEGYEDVLSQVLAINEGNSPLAHIKKSHLIKGDVCETLSVWIAEHPHAIISMAIFDMDIYRPTREALALVVPKLTRGSVLVFDELNCPEFPGETQALSEVLRLDGLRLQRTPLQPYCAWAIWGD